MCIQNSRFFLIVNIDQSHDIARRSDNAPLRFEFILFE